MSDATLVVRGRPTPEELAAVVAMLSARGGPAQEPEEAPRSRWNDRWALLRQPLHGGPGSWGYTA